MHDYFEVQRVLIIAPLRVAKYTWSDEIEKWDHTKYLRVSKILGSKQDRIRGVGAQADIYIVNRENVVWLVDYFKSKEWPFDMVVIDELSSFKSTQAKRFRALRKRSEEHTSELQSRGHLVCRLLLEKKNKNKHE